MPTYRLLTAPDCPLLVEDPAGAELIALANACGQQFNEISNSPVAGVLNRDDGKKLLGRYDKIRELLTRSHYRVGFLGTSSAGKSTIFNRVLQETVAESGSGQATTSLPSRLRRRDEGRKCILQYMTDDQYRDRLKKLCLEVGIGSIPDAEDELLAMVNQLRPSVAGGEDNSQRPIRQDDIVYLKSFLDCYRGHRSKVRPGPAATLDVPFDNRAEYINHSYLKNANQSSDSMLLSEAQLFIPNKNLPERLELCDLPGLNASRSVDTIVTRDFIHQHLDGALLFVNAADNMANAVVKDILGRLTYRYGENLSGRAWVVFNKSDTLTQPHYFPGAGQRSVFDNILDLIRESKIPVTQVCFTSSRLIDDAQEAGGTLNRAKAADRLTLGNDPIPSTLPPDLLNVWEELVKDGGVSRLRHLILHEIAHSVAAQIRQSARVDLTRLAEDITFLAEAEKRRRTGGPALRQKAVTCRNTVLWLRQGLAGRASDFPVLAELRDHLRAKLAQLLCPDEKHASTLKTMPPGKLEQQFHIDARNLDETLIDMLSNEVIDKVFQKVGEHLDPLPAIPIGRYGGVGEAWQEFRRIDRTDEGWQNQAFPSFNSDEVLAGLGGRGHQHFDGETYLDLMGDKVRVAVAQLVHGLRSRLRLRLGELEAELDRLLAVDTK